MKYLSLFLLVGFATIASAQTPAAPDTLTRCGMTDSLMSRNIDPKLLQQMNAQWQNYATKNKANGRLSADDPVLVVPVMFHIAHRGEAVGSGANVSEGQIQVALANLNNAFRVRGRFAAGNDTRIEFVLANCVGIDRADASGIPDFQNQGVIWTNYGQQQQIKALFGTYQDKFVNIYVSHAVTGAGGFAYFGGDMFIRADEFPRTGSSNAFSLTFVHEMGHSLFLRHTFEGDNSCLGCSNDNVVCPANNNPSSDGDQVADTPPHRVFDLGYGTPPNAINFCTGEPFGIGLVRNHMAYYTNADRFTPGQITRMRFYLENYLTKWLNSDAIVTPNDQLVLSPVPTAVCANSTLTLSLNNNSGRDNPVLLIQRGDDVVYYVEVNGNLASFDFPSNPYGISYSSTDYAHMLIPGNDYRIKAVAGCHSRTYGGIKYSNVKAYKASIVGADHEELPKTFKDVTAEVCAGSSITLRTKLEYVESNAWQTVSQSQLTNFNFQWTMNGANISGATGSSYAANTNSGEYRYTITDPGCTNQNQTSNRAAVTFRTTAESYTSDYADGHYPLRTQCSGNSIKLSASYVSNTTAYEWYKDGVLLSGEAGRTLLVSSTGTYRVVPIESACSVAVRADDEITLNFGNSLENYLMVTADSLFCNNGINIVGPSTSSITATKWGEGLTYQWLRNGVEIPNAYQYYYYANQEGVYSLRLRQGNCESVSEAKVVYRSGKEQKPVIVAPSAFGNGLVYTIYAKNSGYSYQWFKDGQQIQDAYQSYLRITSPGTYVLRKGYNDCANDSDPLVVNFGSILSPIIAAQDSVRLVCNDGTAAAMLYMTGSFLENRSGLSYRWTKDGVDIPLANFYADKDYIKASEDGVYRLRVNSGSASGVSNPITVSSGNNRSVRLSSEDNLRLACEGNVINLRFPQISVNDPSLIWKKDGVTLPNQHQSELVALQSGSYTATYQGNGCTVTTEPLPVAIGNGATSATLSGDYAIRAGETANLLLTAPAGLSYFFKLSDGSEYTGSNAAKLIPKSPNLSTTYTLLSFGTHCGLGNASGTARIDVTKCPEGTVNATLATGYWDTPANWSCGSVPTVLDPVRVSAPHTIYLPTNYGAKSKSIELLGKMQQESNATLRIGQE